MADRTNVLQDNQESLLAKEWRKGNRKPNGEKTASMRAANTGKNPTPSSKLAMAERTNSLEGNQAPLHAKKTLTDDAHEAKNGTNQEPSPPEPSRNNVAKKDTTNKWMKDRLKKGKQSNAEGWGAAGMEKSRAQGKPQPKRGDVLRAILREVVEEVAAGVKKVIDTGKALCCAPEPFDVEEFLEDLPSAIRSEPMATLWDKVLV